MCQDGHCDHDHTEPETRSIESDYKLHAILAAQAKAKGYQRQFLRHNMIALQLAQRINMRNEVEKRMKEKADKATMQKLQDAARIAHGHGVYIRKAS